MNTKIEKLMPNPWTIFPDRELYTKQQLTAFAELVVRQCAEIAVQKTKRDYDSFVGESILEHFGIEV